MEDLIALIKASSSVHIAFIEGKFHVHIFEYSGEVHLFKLDDLPWMVHNIHDELLD